MSVLEVHPLGALSKAILTSSFVGSASLLYSAAAVPDTFTVDLRRPVPSASGDQYFVVIAARPQKKDVSWFGHAFVFLGMEDQAQKRSVVDSYGLNLTVNTRTEKAKAVFGLADGQVTSEAISMTNDTSGAVNMTDSIVIKVDQSAFQSAESYVKSFRLSRAGNETAPPLTVTAILHDCVMFAREVAQHAGLTLPNRNYGTPSTFYPTDFLRSSIRSLRGDQTLTFMGSGEYTGQLVKEYTGQVVNGQAHGAGQLTDDTDGSTLTGTFRFGVAEGNGVWKRGNMTVNGTWFHGNINPDNVTVSFKDGAIFTGTIDANSFSMKKGKIKYPDGTTYDGTFSNGQTLNGTAVYPSKETFSGDFSGGVPSRGTYRWPNGNTFCCNYDTKGKYVDGTYNYANGDHYSGTFQDGHYLKGKYFFSDGSIYAGTFKADDTPDTGTFHAAGQPYATVYRDGQASDSGGGVMVPVPTESSPNQGVSGTITN
ncbi:hypothetical protein AB4Y40_40475 [Paraburkholderia sp. EG287B]|uniref:hypothetical protein n=1 Tax=Paraburkholderia sp. EG287B TaxID=3237010 RepID=UPI0034D37068